MTLSVSVPEVTVVIPTIPPRADLLHDAVASVMNQDVPPKTVIVVSDVEGRGPTETRNTGLRAVTTPWVAFLDDDDLLYPSHLRLLLGTAVSEGVDVVYPWFDVLGGTDPLSVPVDGVLRSGLGVPFGEEQKRHLRRHNFIPVTTLVRTEAARAVGGFPYPAGPVHEDWGFLLRLLGWGARFAHCPHTTWAWRHHSSNTSGRPWKGQAT